MPELYTLLNHYSHWHCKGITEDEFLNFLYSLYAMQISYHSYCLWVPGALKRKSKGLKWRHEPTMTIWTGSLLMQQLECGIHQVSLSHLISFWRHTKLLLSTSHLSINLYSATNNLHNRCCHAVTTRKWIFSVKYFFFLLNLGEWIPGFELWYHLWYKLDHLANGHITENSGVAVCVAMYCWGFIHLWTFF